MWILVWLQLLTNSQNIQYYQFETYDSDRACKEALAKASVMVNHKSEALVCIKIDGVKTK